MADQKLVITMILGITIIFCGLAFAFFDDVRMAVITFFIGVFLSLISVAIMN